MVVQLAEHWTRDQMARVRDLIDKRVLWVQDACKIRLGCNILLLPLQITSVDVEKRESQQCPWSIKIVIGNILRDEYHTVHNSPLR